MMEPIAIQLKERTTAPRAGEPLRFGVPLLQGAVKNVNQLQLSNADNTLLPTQSRPLSHWPDGSVRWVCVETLLPVTEKPLADLTLAEGSTESQNAAVISQVEDQIQASYGDFQLIVNHASLNWQWTGPDDQSFFSRLRLDDRDNKVCSDKLDDHWQVKSTGPVVTVLTATGWWHDSLNDKLARFRCELNFYANGLVTAEAAIHNPRRARHPGGLWDLGDPGSIHFGAMTVETDTNGSEQYRLTLSAYQPPRQFSADQRLSLHQESSGGGNWNSRNHINTEGQVLPRFRGYRLQHGHHEPEQGLRAEPIMEAKTADSIISVSLPQFWQNFPSALEADDTTLRAWLFPADKPEAYELQGGERKTQQVILGYGLPLEQLRWSHSPLVPVLAAKHYEDTEAFPWFRANQSSTSLDRLIQEGLDGPSNFFAKREVIDEYSWRNFGEIFADHETLYQDEREPPHISHYNNQYDAIYGFARQFALTGDTRWFELMDDLARHVADIDIYHTSEDRAEYNNGLFWHTDHYLPAHTATHRTFTQHNNTSSTPGQTGGGPAAEHCYTTGLLYHYLLTGTPTSKEAVLDLTQWMVNIHEATNGLLAQLLALKKQELPKLKALIKGEQPSPHRHPFTRGTGNYLTVLLDSAVLEPGGNWLNKAEQVIHDTIHPQDQIDQRNLLDVEIGWSYLILMASIARYLWTKRQLSQIDDAYHYAKESLLHYTSWMQIHERPFLQEAQQLEFANDTWVAQDVRKAMLMFNAAGLTHGQKSEDYIAKGDIWLESSCTSLAQSPEKHFSRILVILAQNYGPQHIRPGTCCASNQSQKTKQTKEQPLLTWQQLAVRILQRIGLGLIQFRPTREKAWLKARINRQ